MFTRNKIEDRTGGSNTKPGSQQVPNCNRFVFWYASMPALYTTASLA